MQIAQQCNGHWHVEADSTWKNYVDRLRWNMHILHHNWNIDPVLSSERFFVHVNRGFNCDADRVANEVLDSGQSRVAYFDSDFCFESHDVAYKLKPDSKEIINSTIQPNNIPNLSMPC